MSKKVERRRGSQVVAVRWHDAHADFAGTWVHENDIDDEPYEVITVGVQVESKSGHVSVAQNRGQEGYYDHIIHIPEAMVQEVVIIGVIGESTWKQQ